jgi:hypothetical protein
MINLRERLFGIVEYHIEEWVDRLSEMGGPGVGGTELAFRPPYTSPAETHDEYVKLALEESIFRTWEEATWCYVYGKYSASIILVAVLLEITLKYELIKRNLLSKTSTLGVIINKASVENILPDQLILKAKDINTRRNDIVHSNVQTDRPESLIHHTGNEHEIEPINDLSKNISEDGWISGDGETIEISFGSSHPTYSRVHIFKRAAKASINEIREILEFLYPRDTGTAQ